MNIIIFLHLNKYLHVCGTGLNVCMSCTNLVESGIASEKSVCVTSINNLALEIVALTLRRKLHGGSSALTPCQIVSYRSVVHADSCGQMVSPTSCYLATNTS